MPLTPDDIGATSFFRLRHCLPIMPRRFISPMPFIDERCRRPYADAATEPFDTPIRLFCCHMMLTPLRYHAITAYHHDYARFF